MRAVAALKHLVARYCWRPLRKLIWLAIPPQVRAYWWVLDREQQDRMREGIKDKTSDRLRGEDKPTNRNGQYKRDDHEQP